MKRKLCVSIVSLVVSTLFNYSSFAQLAGSHRLSFSAGPGLSTYFSQNGMNLDQTKMGMNLTLSYHHADSALLQFACDLSYQRLGFRENTTFTDEVGTIIRDTRLNVVMPYMRLKPSFALGNSFFSFHIGPYASYRMTTVVTGITESPLLYWENSYDPRYKKYDYGVFIQLRGNVPVSENVAILFKSEGAIGVNNMYDPNTYYKNSHFHNVAYTLEFGIIYSLGKGKL